MTKKRGRPPFVKTPEQVLQVVTLAANGFPNEWIADHVGINFKTLTKYFAEDLRVPKKVAAAKLKLTIYQRGMKGELVAALAWLNNHGWGNDNPDGEVVAPPQLGISFEAGGPGFARKVPFDFKSHVDVAPGADRLDDDPVPADATQAFIPKSEPVNLTPASEMPTTPAEKMACAALGVEAWIKSRQIPLEPVRHVAGHPACPCEACKYARARFGHSHEQTY